MGAAKRETKPQHTPGPWVVALRSSTPTHEILRTEVAAHSPCAGCCTDEDCPCTKVCDETYCEKHGREEAAKWAAHFGLRPGMSKQERQNQLEAFRPVGWEEES